MGRGEVHLARLIPTSPRYAAISHTSPRHARHLPYLARRIPPSPVHATPLPDLLRCVSAGDVPRFAGNDDVALGCPP